MLGTPFYMSPEQFVAPKQVDPRTDIWQLGIIMFELIAGAPPFGGETLGQLMYNIMYMPLPSLQQRRPEVPSGLEQAMARCLERDMNRRYANVAELAEAIAPFGTGAQNQFIERMGRTLAVTAGAAGLSGAFAAVPGPITGGGLRPQTGPGVSPGVNTAASWGQASGGKHPPQSMKAPVIIGGALVGLLTILGLVLLVTRGHSHPASTTPPPASTPAATAAPPPAAPSVSAAPTDSVAAPAAPSDSTPPPAAPVEAGVKPAGRPVPPWSGPKPPAGPGTASRPPDQMPDNSRQ